MSRFVKNNSLSIVFFLLFLISMIGQVIAGFREFNHTLLQEGASVVTLQQYFHSGHFIQATFENWESEFLQMALFIVLTISLRQKGSSESKEIDGDEPVDREPSADTKGAPWPVKKGGIMLVLYKHSLSIVFFFLFIVSFILHFYGSLKDENSQLLLKQLPQQTALSYVFNPRFWFESFQNWQSEFLSVFSIVFFSIYLREKGSPQSKPVDAPHAETGE